MKLIFYGGVSQLSRSIIILKEIDGFSYEKTLSSVQRASNKANIHCIHLETAKYFNITGTEVEYLSGGLSEVDADILKSNFERGIHTRQCVFSIEKPTDSSYDSFTWLINKKNYFGALDFQYLSGDYEFVFQFLSQYFRLKENLHDYLWFDDTEWVYSASDMIWLINQPYNPEWAYKKLTPAPGEG